MLHPVYFQGYESPCEAQYGLYIDRGTRPHTLHIIVIQSQPGTSLWNTAEGRDEVLNLVLNQTVAGVRIDQIRYHVILDLGSGLHGITFPIHADIASMKPGNGVEVRGFFRKIYDVWSYALKAGAARCYVNFDEREGLSGSEMERFFAILGYYSPHRRAQLPASATSRR